MAKTRRVDRGTLLYRQRNHLAHHLLFWGGNIRKMHSINAITPLVLYCLHQK